MQNGHTPCKKNNPTLHDELENNNSQAASKGAIGREWKLGLEVDLRQVVVVMQCERGD